MKPYFEAAGVTIFHGDSRAIVPFIDGVNAVVMDPPYGSGYAANPIVGKGKSESNHEDQGWDDAPHDFVIELSRYANYCAIWGGNYYPLTPSRGWLSWLKSDAPPSMASIELCWTNIDMNARQISWSIGATNAERVGHPTQKPYRVMAWTMDQCRIPEGSLVLDPYMGSGTTGIACIRTNRRFIGIDISEEFCETAARRVERELQQGVLAF